MPPDDPRSDEELVAALNGGDASAFDAIYYRYRDRVVRLAYRFTGNDADALDVLQETFAYFYRKFPGFRLSAEMSTFFYPVVRNLSLVARRKRLRMASDDAAVEQLAGFDPPSGRTRSELSAAMASLSPEHREVVLLRFVDDLSLDEIAAALEIPAGTVKSRLHNALAALHEDPAIKKYFL